MTPEAINRLKDDAIVRIVDRMVGGGRKKKAAPRNKRESDMSATDESSSSTLSSERLSLITRVSEAFGDKFVEQFEIGCFQRAGQLGPKLGPGKSWKWARMEKKTS